MNTAHLTTDVRDVARLVDELNDLLQLDYDAAAACALALKALDDPGYQDAVRGFKADHERHIEELAALVRSYDGAPTPGPHLSGGFQLAVQRAAAAGTDAAIVTAFKSNEVQSRDRYRRAASRQHPPDVQGMLIRAARDEQRHFNWAMRTWAELRLDTDAVADALEQLHARKADSLEAAERGAIGLVVAGVVLLGAAAVLAAVWRRR
jgi:hypothetical protein